MPLVFIAMWKSLNYYSGIISSDFAKRLCLAIPSLVTILMFNKIIGINEAISIIISATSMFFILKKSERHQSGIIETANSQKQ